MQAGGEMAMEQRPGTPVEDCDRQLVRAALDGEPAAFDLLVERHWRKVASVAGRFLYDPNDVDDAVQETFVLAFRHLRSFRAQASVRTWLLRITVNVCRSRRTTAWIRRVSLLAHDRLPPGTGVDAAALAEAHLSDAELAEAVARLPEKLREPLVLRFYEELTGPEIAAVLGCKESTVWSRIYTGCRALRKQLEDGRQR